MQFDSWPLARARIKTNSYEIVWHTLMLASDGGGDALVNRCEGALWCSVSAGAGGLGGWQRE